MAAAHVLVAIWAWAKAAAASATAECNIEGPAAPETGGVRSPRQTSPRSHGRSPRVSAPADGMCGLPEG